MDPKVVEQHGLVEPEIEKIEKDIVEGAEEDIDGASLAPSDPLNEEDEEEFRKVDDQLTEHVPLFRAAKQHLEADNGKSSTRTAVPSAENDWT